MKKLVINSLQSVLLIAAGVFIWVLLFKQWLPFDNTSEFAAINIIVPYLQSFGGAGLMALGVFHSYFFKAFVSSRK